MRRLLDSTRLGFQEWRTVAVLLGSNWLVAGLMVAPALPRIFDAFGHAPRAVGRPLLSPQVLLGLGPVFQGGGLPSVAAPLVLLVLLQTFLRGGVVWRACAGGPFRLGAFLGQSGRFLGRIARLYLWLLLLLGLVLLVPTGLGLLMSAVGLPTVFSAGEAWLFGRPFTLPGVLHLGVLALAVALWRLSLEVGRVLLFREDLHVTRRAAWSAMRLVLRSPVSVVLYAGLGAIATLAVLLLARGRAMLPEGNAGLALAVGQAVLWAHHAFQVAGTRFAALLVAGAPGRVEHPPVPAAVQPPP